MSTKYIASNWRLPNQENSSKNDNYGLTFSGSSEYIIIDSSTEIDNVPSNPYSFSFWFKSSTAGRVLSEKRATNTWLNAQYAIHLESGYVKWYGGADGLTAGTQTSTTLIDDEWHHIVCVAESTTVNKIYVDGQLDVTSSANRINSAVIAGAFNIGANYGGSYRFIGQISQFCIFDYALTSTQISTLYGSSSLGSGNPMALKPQPVAYYPLGDNSASNPLTQPNVAVEDATVFDFDSDYINCGKEIGNSIGDNYTGGLTVSGWINPDTTSSDDGVFQFGNFTGYEMALVLNVSKFIFYNNGQKFAVSYTNPNNVWTHFALTFLPSGSVFYVDGAVAANWTYTDLDLNNLDFIIGTYYNSGFTFVGKASNFQIWNTSLLSTEVETLYNSGVPLYTGTQPQAANLKAWYKLNNTANWEADSSGNWQIPDAVSAFPQCFDFENNDKIDINGVNSVFSDATNFTISGWFNWENYSNANEWLFMASGTNINTKRVQIETYNKQLYFSFIGATGVVRVSMTTAQWDAKWVHMVAVFDASAASADKMIIYLNGARAANVAYTEPTGNSPTDIVNVSIGNRTDGLYNFEGKISNFQIWDSALPATGTDSVETLYNNGSPLTTAIASSNLKLWAKLDNNEKFDGTNWSVENQKYPAGFDSALSFPASDDYISIGSTTLGINTAIAISAWVKTSVNTGYGAIINEDNVGNKRNWHLLRKNDDIFFTIYHDASGSSNTNITTSTINVSDNKWHHVVGTWDGTTSADSMKVYFDGVEVAQATPSSTGINTEASAAWIGNSTAQTGGYNNWTGELSNIAVYNTGLDSTAVTALYNNGTPETSISSSPVSWWKLNNLTTGIQDSVGSNDGTNNGATKVNTFVSTEAASSSGMTEQNLVNNNVSALNGESSGMSSANLVTSDLTRAIPYDNYSFSFDSASSDHIDLPSSVDLGLTNTVSMWLNLDSGYSGAVLGESSYGSTGYFLLPYSTGFIVRIGSTTASASNVHTYLTAGSWHHLVVIRSSNDILFYVDGVYIETVTLTTTTVTKFNIIGNSGTGADPIEGKISNISAFTQALTSTEVLKLYSNGVPQDLSSFTPQPVAWYPLGSNSFWNGSAWTCRDMIGSNDGTSANIGADGLVGDAPRSEANGTGTNMDVPSNLEGNTKWSSNNSYSVNMSSLARVEDVA